MIPALVTMMDSFGVKIRMVCAGRPQGNGQAEKYVDILKEKMKTIMAEISSHKKIFFSKLFFQYYIYCNIFFSYEAKSCLIIGTKPLCTLL